MVDFGNKMCVERICVLSVWGTTKQLGLSPQFLNFWTWNSFCSSFLSGFNHTGSSFMFVCPDSKIPIEFRSAFFCNFRNATKGKTCLTRCSLRKQTRFTIKSILSDKKTRVFSPSWQWNNATVLFILCFDTTLSTANHRFAFSSNSTFVWFLRLMHTPSSWCVSLWMWTTHLQYKMYCVRPNAACCPLMYLVSSSLASLASLFRYRVINQTSGCQNARQHFYPVMPTYSLFLTRTYERAVY